MTQDIDALAAENVVNDLLEGLPAGLLGYPIVSPDERDAKKLAKQQALRATLKSSRELRLGGIKPITPITEAPKQAPPPVEPSPVEPPVEPETIPVQLKSGEMVDAPKDVWDSLSYMDKVMVRGGTMQIPDKPLAPSGSFFDIGRAITKVIFETPGRIADVIKGRTSILPPVRSSQERIEEEIGRKMTLGEVMGMTAAGTADIPELEGKSIPTATPEEQEKYSEWLVESSFLPEEGWEGEWLRNSEAYPTWHTNITLPTGNKADVNLVRDVIPLAIEMTLIWSKVPLPSELRLTHGRLTWSLLRDLGFPAKIMEPLLAVSQGIVETLPKDVLKYGVGYPFKYAVGKPLQWAVKTTGEKLPAATSLAKEFAASEAGGLKLPPIEPIPPEMPATQRVFSHISFGEKGPSIGEKASRGWDKFNTAMIDDLYPIKKFVSAAGEGGAKLSMEENPYIWARALKGIASKANTMLEKGTFGKQYWKMVEGKAVPDFKGPGLRQVLEPVKEPATLRDFTTYLTSLRSIELAGRGIKTGIKTTDAKAAVKELAAKYPNFAKTAEGVYKYQNDVLNYAQEAGLLSKELVTRLQTSKSYVPFQRVFEELASKGFMGKKMADIFPPIKRIKGSKRAIINPLESVVKNTHLLVGAADRNEVGIMMANLVSKNPELAPLFMRVKTPISRVAQVTARELGISVEGLSKGETEQVFNVFRPSMFTKENVVSVLVDGKKSFFKVDPDLYKGLLNLDRESIGMMGKLLGFPAKWLRAGATLSPDFMVRNPLRDQMTAFAYSNYGFLPGVDFLRGVASIVGRDKYYSMFKMSGAEHSMLVSIDREYLNSSFQQVVRGKGFTNYVKHPLELLQIVSELGEKGTRMGEFVKGVKAGATPLKAGMSARNVSLDFGQMGTTTRGINSLIAFFNANIRGWTKMAASFKENPVRTSAKVFAGITLPSMLLYLANRNDPRWKEIPQWQKDLFWIVMTEDNIYRIPKPFELGIIFGSIPERFMEYIDNKDPDMLTEAMENAFSAGSPGFMPTAILPVIENLSNYSFFLDRPIVSAGKESYPPALQYTGTSSEVSKKLGEMVNYSPAKIDNVINGYTGGLGRYATDILDVILKGTGIASDIPEPSPTMADMPVLKAFVVRDPYGSSSASIDKFYDKLSRYEQGEKYLKAMLEAGNEAKFNNYKATHPEIMPQYNWQIGDLYSVSARYLRRVSGQLSELRSKQNDIYNDPDMSPEDKRSKITEINKLMTSFASQAIGNLDLMPEELRRTGVPRPPVESRGKAEEWREKYEEAFGG